MSSPYGSPDRSSYPLSPQLPLQQHTQYDSPKTPTRVPLPLSPTSPHSYSQHGTPLASPMAEPSSPYNQQPRPASAGTGAAPPVEPYVPVFDSRRALFASSPHASPTSSLSSPTGDHSFNHGQVQQAVNDVAASRFAQFIPSSPHPGTQQPVQVLVFDQMNVVVAGQSAPGSPQQVAGSLQPLSVNELDSPSQYQPNHTSPQILGISQRFDGERSMTRTGQVYTFGDDEEVKQDGGVRIHTAPQADAAGLGSAGPQPLSPTAATTGTVAAAPVPQAPQYMLPGGKNGPQIEDLEEITLKIGGCFDLDERLLLYGGWAMMFLMFLFVCIAFGVSWTEGNSYNGGRVHFAIQRFQEWVPDTVTNTSSTVTTTVNGTTTSTTTWSLVTTPAYDYSSKYTHVTSYHRQCQIDDYRVPTCLGLGYIPLFLMMYALWKRKQNHLDITWRRLTILFMFLFGGFMFLACIMWWQGCHNFAKAATRIDGTAELNEVTFTGGWWLTMFNLFVTFLMIGVQATAYGEEKCCVCTC